MHVVTWIDMMDAWGNIAPQSEWKQKQWTGQFLKQALYRIKKLNWLKTKGKVADIKHIFEE